MRPIVFDIEGVSRISVSFLGPGYNLVTGKVTADLVQQISASAPVPHDSQLLRTFNKLRSAIMQGLVTDVDMSHGLTMSAELPHNSPLFVHFQAEYPSHSVATMIVSTWLVFTYPDRKIS